MVRVFLVDDHEVVRRGVRDLIEADRDLTVVGEAGSAEQALSTLPPTTPDVVVLDVRLPGGDGIELCRELRARHPELACLMLTSFDDEEALLAAVMAGAAGYVLKQIKGTDLVDSIKRVGAGESLLNAAMAQQALERRQAEEAISAGADARYSRLTPQERRLLDFIAEGYTNRQIAERMFLAEKTVKNYVSNLLLKLGLRRRTEAAVFAVRRTGSGGERPRSFPQGRSRHSSGSPDGPAPSARL